MTTTLLAVNLAGATAAALANLWAALTGPCHGRPIRATIAALAAMYAGLYTVNMLGWMTADARVAFAQGIGPIVWLVVWTAPAVRSTVVHHRNLDAMRSMIRRVDEVAES